MNYKKYQTKKIFTYFVAALVLVISSFFLYTLVTAVISFGEPESGWDGYSIASSFEKGNGSLENPYVLRTAEEFMYFKSLIEGDSYTAYQDKYFVLGDDIDFNGNAITPIGTIVEEEERIFRGSFDGKGHSLTNFKIIEPTVLEDVSYYALFPKTVDVTISNIVLENYRIEVTEEVEGTINVSGFIGTGEVLRESSLENVILRDFNIDISGVPSSGNTLSVLGTVSQDMVIQNVYMNGEITNNGEENEISLIGGEENSHISNIIQDVIVNQASLEETFGSEFYLLRNGEFSLRGEVVSQDTVLSFLNDTTDSSYYWDVEDGKLVLKEYEEIVEEEVPITSKSFAFSIRKAPAVAIPLHDSGIEGTNVYINDLVSDYNYYQGLNYTKSNGGLLPTGVKGSLYTDSNLVKVYIHYSGTDLNDDSLKATVGLSSNGEGQSDFYYYKYYPISSGVLTFDLMDNPYSNLPNDKGFNGWITDYEGATISLDRETYTRKVSISGVSGGDVISIHFYASFVDASVATATSEMSSNLKTGMVPYTPYGRKYEDLSVFYISATIQEGEAYTGNGSNGNFQVDGTRITDTLCSSTTCTYLIPNPVSDYVEGTTYYEVSLPSGNGNATVTVHNPTYTEEIIAGMYKQVKVTNGGNIAGLYDNTGKIATGTCSSTTCNMYELLQYYDESGNPTVVDSGSQYYYLATRDTNFFIPTVDITSGGYPCRYPMTVTGLHNGVFTTRQVLWSYFTLNDDIRYDHITLYRANNNTVRMNGRMNNVKLARHVITPTTNFTFAGAGMNNAVTAYRRYVFILESGTFKNLYGFSSGHTTYGYHMAVLGSDYDRVKMDNTQLTITSNYAPGNQHNMYATSTAVTTDVCADLVIKSGNVGTEEDSWLVAGAYMGITSSGRASCATSLLVEGGFVRKLVGGVTQNETGFKDLNYTYLNMKGGTTSMVIGGASYSTTYGNRIINITGGTVEYSIFGGSNGALSSGDAVLDSSTFIYVGGNAVIGTATDDYLFEYNNGRNNYRNSAVEPGSIFGAGNGRSGNNLNLGLVTTSHIVIDGNPTISGNVYGGGNFGRVGNSGLDSATTIDIHSGTIAGSVYGGGNNNGAGYSNQTATTNINVSGGTVEGSIYGGSRTKGVIYGNTNVTVTNGNIEGDVYGGGEGGYTNNNSPGTYVTGNVAVTINDGTIEGSVYGGSAYGTVNASSQNASASTSTTKVTVNGGVIEENVFGGGKGSSTFTPQVAGPITVTINDGTMGKVFGGFDDSGKPTSTDVVYLKGGTIGDAFGGGNNANQDQTDIRLLGSTITGNLYGGSNLLGTVTSSLVTVDSGSVTNVFGGNNLAGLTVTTNVVVTGGDIHKDVYGGGNQAESSTTNVKIYNGNLNDVYGGGYSAGVSGSTNVTVYNGTIDHLFGGSNTSGTVGTTNVVVQKSYENRGVSHLVSSNLVLDDRGTTWTDNTMRYIEIRPTIQNTSDQAYTEWTAKITVPGSSIFYGFNYLNSQVTENNGTYTFTQVNKYDANQPYVIPAGGEVTIPGYFAIQVPIEQPYELKFEISAVDNTGATSYYVDNYIDGIKVEDLNKGINYIYGGNNLGGSTQTSNIDVTDGVIGEIYGGGNKVGVTTTNVNVVGGEVLDVFGGSNQSGDVTTSNVTIGDDTHTVTIENVYGGNNDGGVTNNSNVTIEAGEITNVYGGGNQADVGGTNVVINGGTITDAYGGGNAASVQRNTVLDLNGGVVTHNIYGGGNEGIVSGNTSVFITDAAVQGNAFAGGNGSTAVVYKNSTITVDGTSEIGTGSSVAPDAGCVFGSGNAASTGLESTDNSVATVNIVGGTIHGNVYGGPKMAVVYGVTETNIGTAAVNDNSLTEDDILISGTVFGGGESNASGSETYDWTFISVTEGINVHIDGTGYIANDHEFIINGSVFGSGNASSSSGNSNIYIKNLGTLDKVNKAISIQRANYLEIDSSVIELEGTTDRTNEYSDILYSFNMIDKMVIKNGTTLLLKHNANMLKELYSGVDSNGSLVPAVVDIDEDSKTVTKNVDNRIYMIPGQNLNITINQAATAYGKVTGMTFFGMYQSYESGNYRFGLYDQGLSYGDSGNASLEIVGGSYVIGLRNVDHDITKDGFYSNYLDEETYSEVFVNYIDPSAIGETGYRWIIGFEAINYEFTLTASRYSSLGTYELQLIDFADGDTIFDVLGFDSSGLKENLSLVDSNAVPRVGTTEEEANSIFGLSMKSETQEWTGYGTTKMISDDGGAITGDKIYQTDSRKLPPSLMFYLYHAKNINCEGKLGTVVMSLQAAIPKTAIDYDIKFITITINLTAIDVDSDSYDASITYDKKYELPSSTSVNITNQSQFSTYFSLTTFKDKFADVYGKNNTNIHVLVTNHPLPVNTMITMLDYGTNPNRPEYYYFRVTQDVYNDSVQQLSQYNEITYRLNQFIKMDSTSSDNTYDDAAANLLYYDEDLGLVDEEFMFIFDFKECEVAGNHLDNTMLFELRTNEDRTVFSVLGIREALMVYNTFESSNVVLNQTFADTDSYLYYDVTDNFSYSTQIQYNETENRQSVIDTNYESSSMGLNIVFLDKDGEQVSSSLLVGTSFTIGGQQYFADGDGVYRMKLANKVSNLNRDMSVTVNKNLPAGEYTIQYTLFASDDGLHNSVFENSVTQEFPVSVVSADNSIVVNCEDRAKVVDGSTGLNLLGTRINTYTVQYESQLTNPNFRVEVYKRDITTIDSVSYTSIPFRNLFTNPFTIAQGNEVLLNMIGETEKSFDFELQETLTSGTYKVVFKLYDNNQLIDEDVKYVIVNKKTE